jgi:hypothetical protein
MEIDALRTDYIMRERYIKCSRMLKYNIAKDTNLLF